ncbi:hypothetical protein PF005_g4615 [Phytophthora fragariae]|uniref:Uncharacterized protein n=1 Tax=Phytophthora fragariae TaxID=53985 RepID=A0A6A4EIG5_9STRA|nr:hypothetical protein PF005_g4615 [Phytophthora fragariae]KAE9323341.1 hypothetical protein PF001_g3958 [Phytophthora fragariae]
MRTKTVGRRDLIGRNYSTSLGSTDREGNNAEHNRALRRSIVVILSWVGRRVRWVEPSARKITRADRSVRRLTSPFTSEPP